MTEVANEEKLCPYYCPQCEQVIFVLWAEESFAKVYRCLTCRQKHLKKVGVVFFGRMRMEEMPGAGEKPNGRKSYKDYTKESNKMKLAWNKIKRP